MKKNYTHIMLLLIAAFVLNTSGTVMAMDFFRSKKKSRRAAWLLKAAHQGNTDEVERLLTSGANVDAPDDGGYTPLHVTAWKGHRETAELLLASGANVAATDFRGRTPLHWAAYPGHLETAALLLASGANVDAINDKGYTPLHVAVGEGRRETAKLLLTSGAKVDATDNMGYTPLHAATWKSHPETAKLLLASGAKVDATGYRGYTPLHIVALVAWKDRRETAKLLLSEGAYTSIKNKQDKTPSEVAKTEKIRKLIRDAIAKRATITTLLSIQEATKKGGAMAGLFVYPDIQDLLAQAIFQAHEITPSEDWKILKLILPELLSRNQHNV